MGEPTNNFEFSYNYNFVTDTKNDGRCDCGFFMLYMLENSNGDYVKRFTQEDIQSYKELLLMRMLTSNIFNIHMQNLDVKILGKHAVHITYYIYYLTYMLT